MKYLIAALLIVTTLNAVKVDVNEYIPPRALEYMDMLYTEIDEHFNEFILPPYFASLIEHESCIFLTSKLCWSPKARLKTKREEGAGFPQLTRAYRTNGTLRFDTINDLRIRYGKELKELTWNNVYDRPDLQIRAMILLYKSNFDKLPDTISYWDKMAMSDSAYNGGYRLLYKDRTKCGLKANCDPLIWFDNVEMINSRGNKILYGNRTSNQINRHHVDDVMNIRFYKYVLQWVTPK